MTLKELSRLKVLEKLANRHFSQLKAAEQLGLSDRLKSGVCKKGVARKVRAWRRVDGESRGIIDCLKSKNIWLIKLQ
jgi:predicted transcriptional regulator